jgi:hypothetical protein
MIPVTLPYASTLIALINEETPVVKLLLLVDTRARSIVSGFTTILVLSTVPTLIIFPVPANKPSPGTV